MCNRSLSDFIWFSQKWRKNLCFLAHLLLNKCCSSCYQWSRPLSFRPRKAADWIAQVSLSEWQESRLNLFHIQWIHALRAGRNSGSAHQSRPYRLDPTGHVCCPLSPSPPRGSQWELKLLRFHHLWWTRKSKKREKKETTPLLELTERLGEFLKSAVCIDPAVCCEASAPSSQALRENVREIRAESGPPCGGISSAFPSALTAPHYVGWDRLQNKATPRKHLTHQRVWVPSASLRLAVTLKNVEGTLRHVKFGVICLVKAELHGCFSHTSQFIQVVV